MKYTLSSSQASSHFIDVCCEIENTTTELIVKLPLWRPGRYELGNFAKNIQKMNFFDADMQPLEFRKTTKSEWNVKTNNTDKVTAKYRFYANELNAGSTYLDANQLYVNPVNCMIYIEDKQHEICELKLEIPESYKVATSLKSLGNNIFLAENFQELADSPFIASAKMQHQTFLVQGVTFHLWFEGECKPDFQKIITDFSKYTEEQIKIFGDFPVEEYHYLFQLLPYAAYHGVEHQKSTAITLGPSYNLMKKVIYDELLGVSCHELFHTWNIKNIRPKEMMPYDFGKENYSRLGYVAEGVTTYYGDLLLWRSGLFTEQEFIKIIQQYLQKHLDNFGRFNHSVAESSFDTWLDGYVKGIPNRKLSIYSDGCLIAFMVDTLIRQATNNTKNLDNIMQSLYLNFGKKGVGYTESDYQKTIEKVAGISFTNFFKKYVAGTNSYLTPLQACFDFVGWELKIEESSLVAEKNWGLKMSQDGLVVAVHPCSVASEKGIAQGDRILSVNHFNIKNNANDWINYFENETVTLSVLKNDNTVIAPLEIPTNGKFTFYKKHKITVKNNA